MRQIDTTFYGWTNRSTWAVAQLIRENPELERDRRELCRWARAWDDSSSEPRLRLSHFLEDWITGLVEKSRQSQDGQTNSVKFLLQVVEIARRHRANATTGYGRWMTPDQILALSLEAWAVALLDVIGLDDEGDTIPLHHFDEIGSFSDVNWFELADTFLVDAD